MLDVSVLPFVVFLTFSNGPLGRELVEERERRRDVQEDDVFEPRGQT